MKMLIYGAAIALAAAAIFGILRKVLGTADSSGTRDVDEADAAAAPNESVEIDITPDMIKGAKDFVISEYGNAIADNVDKIFRLETRHYQSKQVRRSLSAGMLKFGSTFPYGWSSLVPLWTKYPAFAPIGSTTFTVSGKQYTYLRFSSLTAGFMAVAEIMKIRGNNPGRWNSTKPEEIAEYNRRINRIRV